MSSPHLAHHGTCAARQHSARPASQLPSHSMAAFACSVLPHHHAAGPAADPALVPCWPDQRHDAPRLRAIAPFAAFVISRKTGVECMQQGNRGSIRNAARRRGSCTCGSGQCHPSCVRACAAMPRPVSNPRPPSTPRHARTIKFLQRRTCYCRSPAAASTPAARHTFATVHSDCMRLHRSITGWGRCAIASPSRPCPLEGCRSVPLGKNTCSIHQTASAACARRVAMRWVRRAHGAVSCSDAHRPGGFPSRPQAASLPTAVVHPPEHLPMRAGQQPTPQHWPCWCCGSWWWWWWWWWWW
jgi:hypothetical protein